MRSMRGAVLAGLLVLAGCGGEAPETGPQLEGVTDRNVTVIAINGDGDMVDFVHITPEAHIQSVEFLAPESGEEIYATWVGPAQSPGMQQFGGNLVSSSVAPGKLGKVRFEVEKGVLSSFRANGVYVEPNSPVTMAMLEEIKAAIKSGKQREHPESTVIVHVDPHLRDLVTDGDGNELPPQLSLPEQAFLDAAIPAIRNGDAAALEALLHPLESDAEATEMQLRFIKASGQSGFTRYRFSRFTPEHPDYDFNFERKQDVEMIFSLPPEWALVLYDERPGYSSRALHKIGVEDGELKFITDVSRPVASP
ncbi:MAG: hypothetical protein AAGK14_12415 [Verrucomicrobiota bacterium]